MNSVSFKVSKGACHRARVQGAYIYTVFENLTYRSGQPYTYSLPPDQAFTENKGVEQGHIFITTSLSIY